MMALSTLTMRYKGPNAFSTHFYPQGNGMEGGSAMNCRGIIQIFGGLGLAVPTPETLSTVYYVLPRKPHVPGYKELKLASTVYPPYGNMFPYMIRDTRYIGEYVGDDPFNDCTHVPVSTEMMIALCFIPNWLLDFPFQPSGKLLSDFGRKLTSEYIQHQKWVDFGEQPYYPYSLWLTEVHYA